MTTRIYLVRSIQAGTYAPRLIRATNSHRALAHAVHTSLIVSLASQEELLAMAATTKVENDWTGKLGKQQPEPVKLTPEADPQLLAMVHADEVITLPAVPVGVEGMQHAPDMSKALDLLESQP